VRIVSIQVLTHRGAFVRAALAPVPDNNAPALLQPSLRLDQLPADEWATVLDLRRPEAAEDRELVLRLTEIGFVPGEAVRIIASGVPGREPLAVRLGHTTFALRRHEASFVQVAPGAAHHG
jgi:ferrous iron transport protein A